MEAPYSNNFVVLGNFKINENVLGFTFENGIEIRKDPHTKNQVIICRDEKIIETEDIKYITLVLELFQGQYTMKSEEKIGSKIKFFLGRYKYSSIDQKIKKIIKECQNNITQKGKYKKTLKDEFLFTEKEAKFITDIRNDIIHESLFLDESIEKNFGRLQLDNDSELYGYLSSVTNSIIRGYILGIYLEEVIYKYILKKNS